MYTMNITDWTINSQSEQFEPKKPNLHTWQQKSSICRTYIAPLVHRWGKYSEKNTQTQSDSVC